MSDNVIKFPEQDEIIFICGCECSTFSIHQNGNIECANCGDIKNAHTDNPGEWVKRLPDIPLSDEITRTDSATVKQTFIGSKEFALKSVLKQINEWVDTDNLVFVAAYNEDGEGKHWFVGGGKDQINWLVRKLNKLISFILKGKPDD